MTIIKYFGNLNTLAKRAATAALFGSMTALLVSCGGSGVDTGGPLNNGLLSILPSNATFYANVPATLTVAGGTGPYFITSSEPAVMPLNFMLNGNTFTTVPNQPAVVNGFSVDIVVTTKQIDSLSVPFRTVTVTARDSKGIEIKGVYDVLQNFLTGYYNFTITSTAACGAGPLANEACAGSDSLLTFLPVSGGLRLPNKLIRFTANYGPFAFILDSTGITGPTVTATSDEQGAVTARIRVTANTQTQYGQFRMTDVVTGAYRDVTFVIRNANGANVPLSVLPDTVTLGGATKAACGTGSVNVFVFGGLPPYTASTSFPNQIRITPTSVAKSGDAFTVTAFDPTTCLNPGTVVFTDTLGAFTSMKVTTTVGTADPVLPLSVAPSSLCIPDGGSGVVSISGGNNIKVINSSSPALATATPTTGTGNFTTTINSLGAGGAGGTQVTFTVNDGGASATIAVTRKTVCP